MKTHSLILLLLSTILFISSCGESAQPRHALGWIEAEWLFVGAPRPGWIVRQPIREGDFIEADTVLFNLDIDTEASQLAEANARVEQAKAQLADLETGVREPEMRALQAQLKQAEAQAELALIEYERIKPLVERGLEPPSRGDQARLQYNAAQSHAEALAQEVIVASLGAREAQQTAASAGQIASIAAKRAAEYRLAERTVTAKRAGKVEEIFFRPGEYVVSGKPVVSLLPRGALKARFFVPIDQLPQLSLGQAVTVAAEGLAPITATVTFIGEEAEFTPPVIYAKDTRGKLVFMVEAALPDESVHPGLPVEVSW